jgi:hypothetical protein
MKPEPNDYQHFCEVINSPIPFPKEVYQGCPHCIAARSMTKDENTICDDHFIHRFGDLLDGEDWAKIETRRGRAFVERWQRLIYLP